MTNQRGSQNPDVNSYDPNTQPGEEPGVTEGPKDGSSDIERQRGDDVIPVPPDVGPTAPIEEPPGNDAPVGDVDDSPKRIA